MNARSTQLLAGLLLLATSAWLCSGSGARAASFRVDALTDGVDAAPGDGRCLTAEGRCSLRAAIQEANALPGADLVTLGPGRHVLNRAGGAEDSAQSGDLDVREDLTVRGAGSELSVVDAAGLDRVFDLPVDGVRLKLAHLGLRGGGEGLGNAIRGTVGCWISLFRCDVKGSSANTAVLAVAEGGRIRLYRSLVRSDRPADSGLLQADAPVFAWQSRVALGALQAADLER